MKLIGILGGISPFSTTYYYELLNDLTRKRLGARHSVHCLIHAVDFADVEAMHVARDWPDVTKILEGAARSLEAGGADCVLLACNTMHNVADAVERAVSIPFLHIGDAAADSVAAAGVQRVGLLGTRFTMEAPFIRSRLEARGIEVVVPDGRERGELHTIIYDELCAGITKPASRERFLRVIERMTSEQAIEGVVLGCTEIGLLLDIDSLAVPGFDTARSHAEAAIEYAIGAKAGSGAPEG